MFEIIEYVFGAANFLPHGLCLAWRPDLVAIHVGSDALIFLSYSSIPFAMVYFLSRRKDLEFGHVFKLFAAFILACGITHLMGAITLWHPLYGLHGLVKLMTALISVATALVIWPIIPKALALPSPSQLATANLNLQDEITQRREAEAEVRHARDELEQRVNERTQELAETNSRLRAILDNVVEGVISIDTSGEIQHWSASAERIFGYSADQVIGKNVSTLMPEPDRSGHDGYLQAYHDTAEKKIIGIGREVVGLRSDGTEFAMELSVGEAIHGDTREFVGLVRDITDRKATELALEEAVRAAESANLAKSQFLSNMSHELRTPLNSIVGFAQLLGNQDKEVPPERQANRISQIVNASQILLDLIQQVLDLSRIESGGMTFDTRPVNVHRILDECVEILGPIAEERDVSVNLVCPDRSLIIETDELRSKQALINLGTNAIKYNRAQGHVEIEVSQSGSDACRIEVSDTGKGIPAGRQQELFEPFNRLGAEKSNVEGTGIGLALTKRIVEGLGGQIGFESNEGVGSMFWIELPLSQRAVDIGSAIAGDALEISRVGKSNGLVLYIEDNPANLTLMEDIFDEIPNLRLIATHTAEAGVEIARAQQPDIIILDINLPGMDGFDALRILKSHSSTFKTPVIALSADAARARISEGLDAGFDEYLTKPVDISQLIETLRRLLEDR